MSNSKLAKPGQYLAFTLNGQVYGVPIETVREINRVSKITPVPQAPEYIAGVISLRGNIIPTVNLRMKFEMPSIEFTKETCIILIEGTRGRIGIIVDSVRAVIDLTENQIEQAPPVAKGDDVDYLLGMAKTDEQVIVLLDVVRCLSKENISNIAESDAAKAA